MKQLAVLIVLLFCLSPALKAQLYGNLLPSRYMYGPRHLTLEQIQGTPYLNPDFVNGKVTTTDGSTFNDIPLRYNCYSDVIEFKKEDVGYDIDPKNIVDKVEFGGRVFGYLQFEPGFGHNMGYFQILAEGKAKLCVKYQIGFLEREELRGYATPKPDRFDNLKVTYWISMDNAPAKQILNKGKFLELFSEKKNEVEGFMASKKLTIKKEDDLKKIVSYYNTL